MHRVQLHRFANLIFRAGRRLRRNPSDLYDGVVCANPKEGRRQSALNLLFHAVCHDFRAHPGEESTPRDPMGATLLHWMAVCNQSKLLRDTAPAAELLELRDNEGRTPTMLAAGYGSTDALGALLDLGGDPNSCTTDGTTPLYIATLNDDLTGAALLLDADANPAQVVAGKSKGKQAEATPLMLSVKMASLPMAKLLIGADADPNQQCRNGSTALSVAAQHNHLRMARYLLDQGAEVDLVGKGGATALLLAVTVGHAEMARLLLRYGADPLMSNAEGAESALISAIRYKRTGCLGVIKEHLTARGITL